MNSYFPQPYPDELLYSAIARFDQHTLSRSWKTTSLELFGKYRAIPAIDLNIDITELVRRAGHLLDLTAADVLWKHTLFPYYSAGLAIEDEGRLGDLMLGPNGAKAHMQFGINTSRVKRPLWLRVCPDCIQDDLTRHGETYWRRIFQIPGVQICPWHGTPLYETGIPYRAVQGKVIIPAQRNQATGPVWVGDSAADAIALRSIAETSYALLNRQADQATPIRAYDVSRTAILTSAHHRFGRRAVSEIEEAFVNFYGGSFLNRLGVDFPRNSLSSWFRRLLRNDRGVRHTIQHILWAKFAASYDPFAAGGLCGSARKRTRNGRHPGANRAEPWKVARPKQPRARTGDGPANGESDFVANTGDGVRKTLCSRDGELSVAARAEAVRLLAVEPPNRITRCLLAKGLGLQGLQTTLLDRMPLTKSVFEELCESVASAQCRRLRWAEAALYAAGKPMKAWQLRKFSGLSIPGLHTESRALLEQILGRDLVGDSTIGEAVWKKVA